MKRGVLLVFLVLILLLTSLVIAVPDSAPATPGSVDDDSSEENETDVAVNDSGFPDDLLNNLPDNPFGVGSSFDEEDFSGEGIMSMFDLEGLMKKVRLYGILAIVFVVLMISQFIGFIVFLIYFFHLLKESKKVEVAPELAQYVNSCRVAGTTKEQVMQVLLQQGYDQETINLALNGYVTAF